MEKEKLIEITDEATSIIALYSKGWFKRDSELTSLRKLMKRLYYTKYDIMPISQLLDIVLNKFEQLQIEMYKNENYNSNHSTSNIIRNLFRNKYMFQETDDEKALLNSLLSSISMMPLKLPCVDAKIINIEMWSFFKNGLTYKETQKYINTFNFNKKLIITKDINNNLYTAKILIG